ncbi:MAG: hypothetical protein WCL06_14110, partial [Bacteroidota bacterium]
GRMEDGKMDKWMDGKLESWLEDRSPPRRGPYGNVRSPKKEFHCEHCVFIVLIVVKWFYC